MMFNVKLFIPKDILKHFYLMALNVKGRNNISSLEHAVNRRLVRSEVDFRQVSLPVRRYTFL